MKKKVLITALSCVLSLGFFTTSYYKKENRISKLSGLQIENLEALTENEAIAIGCIKYKGGICVLIFNGDIIGHYEDKIPYEV